MTDLIVRPTGLRAVGSEYVLQLRRHTLGECDYEDVAYMTESKARAIVDAGACFWLFGDPIDGAKKRSKKKVKK